MKEKERVFIIDGHGLIYRAYYAFIKNPLLTSKGENTSSIFAFLKILLRLIKEYSPKNIIVVFDSKEPSFRQEIYKEYKANRQEMPEDLPQQIDAIKDFLKIVGIKTIEVSGYEGDDIIGTLADKLKNDYEVYIITGDKDALQLIDNNVKILQMKKGISEVAVVEKKNAKEHFGIPPELIPDFFGLAGDPVDNIPGVKGIGEKTAKKLINEFGSLDEIYKNIEKIKPERIKKLLIEQKDQAYLSKELATIKRDAPIDLKDSFSFDIRKLIDGMEILKRYELKSIEEDIINIVGLKDTLFDTIKEEKRFNENYILINKEQDLKKVRDHIKKYDVLSIDTETTGLKFYNSKLVGISISCEEGKGFFIYTYPDTDKDYVSIESVKSTLKDIFENSEYKKVGQNIKFDALILRENGIHLEGIYFDTMIAAYLLSEERESLSLDTLAKKYLGYTTMTYKELIASSGRKKKKIQDVDIDKLVFYATEDSDIAFRLYKVLKEKIEKEGFKELFYNIEMPLVEVLTDMEWHGVLLDEEYLRELSVYYEQEIHKIIKEIFELVGHEFNINSPVDLRKVLFDELGLPVLKKTQKEKLPSTDTEVLEELKHYHPVIPLLLRYRELSKLKSTYTDALLNLINPKTKRVHTSYNQTRTATGRLSSQDPNLQNIPIRGEEGKKIRRAFIAPEGYKIYSFDYNQIELRLVAHFSQDPKLIEAFKAGEDIHRKTASYVFGVSEDKVDSDLRRKAKSVNFGIIYGLTEHGLSKQIKVSRTEARKILESYFKEYSGVKKFIENTIKEAEKKGYVETIMGRRRYIPHIRSNNKTIKKEAERIAINTPIQGSAADIIKKAMNEIYSYIKENSLKTKMILQVHDELLFEIPEGEEPTVPEKIKEIMENVVKLSIPLTVDYGSGKSWGEAH